MKAPCIDLYPSMPSAVPVTTAYTSMGMRVPAGTALTFMVLPPSGRRRSMTRPACETPLDIMKSRIPVNKPGVRRAKVFDGSIVMTTLLKKVGAPRRERCHRALRKKRRESATRAIGVQRTLTPALSLEYKGEGEGAEGPRMQLLWERHDVNAWHC